WSLLVADQRRLNLFGVAQGGRGERDGDADRDRSLLHRRSPSVLGAVRRARWRGFVQRRQTVRSERLFAREARPCGLTARQAGKDWHGGNVRASVPSRTR